MPGEAVPTTPAAPPVESQKPPEDILDIVLEGMDKPVKVPVSKIPLDKLQPHLAKLRSEADRRMSEADKRAKDLDARAQRYSTVDKLAEAIKADPDAFLKLGEELGLTEEQLYALSEKQVANRIRAQLREQEESQDPTKKTAREQTEELEKLRKERKEFEEQKAKDLHARVKGNLEGLMIQALDTLPAGLRREAAREMTNILRAAIEEDVVLSPADLAKAAHEALRRRAQFVYDEDERAKPKPVKTADRPQHPSEKPNPGTGKSKLPPKKNGENHHDSSDLLLKLLRPVR